MRATEIGIETNTTDEFIDITDRLSDLLKEQGWREGLLLVYAPHTTAGICISENADSDKVSDVLTTLGKLAPTDDDDYANESGSSPAHVKSVLVGNQVFVPVVAGKMQLGRWEGVFFSEFYGPRKRIIRLYFMED